MFLGTFPCPSMHFWISKKQLLSAQVSLIECLGLYVQSSSRQHPLLFSGCLLQLRISWLRVLPIALCHLHGRITSFVGFHVRPTLLLHATERSLTSLVPTWVTVLQILRTRAIEQHSSLPYISSLPNFMLWTAYGLPFVHHSRNAVEVVNIAGSVMMLTSIIIFGIFGDRNLRLKLIGVVAGVLLVLSFIVGTILAAMNDAHHRSRAIGIIAAIYNVLSYGVPLRDLYRMPKAIKLKGRYIFTSVPMEFVRFLFGIIGNILSNLALFFIPVKC